MPAATRESDHYWHTRPADHSSRGFFMLGPQEPVQPLTRLAELVESRCSEQPEGPRGARQRMAREKADKARILENQQRFLAALRGERVPRSRRGFVHRAA